MLKIFYIEQNAVGLNPEDDYLTEAMILAKSREDAIEAAVSLADEVDGFGYTVDELRLTCIECGPAPKNLLTCNPRWSHGESKIMVVGSSSNIK